MALIRRSIVVCLLAVLALHGPVQAQNGEGFGVVFKNFVKSRQGNIRSVTESIKNAVRQYNIDFEKDVESITDLVPQYISTLDQGDKHENCIEDPENLGADEELCRFFGRFTLNKVDQDEGTVTDIIIKSKPRYDCIVKRALPSFDIMNSTQTGRPMDTTPCDNSDGEGRTWFRFRLGGSGETTSFAQASAFMLQEDLENRIKNMVAKWKGKKVDIINDNIVLTTNNHDNAHDHADHEQRNIVNNNEHVFFYCYPPILKTINASLDQKASDYGCDNEDLMSETEDDPRVVKMPSNTYTSMLMVMAIFNENQPTEGNDGNPEIIIPPLARFPNPQKDQTQQLIPFKEGGRLIASAGHWGGRRIRIKTINLPDHLRVEIVRLVVWTPSFEDEGVEFD